MKNLNQPTVQEVAIETSLDEFQITVAVARHQAINNKKTVDTSVINILIWLVETNPGLVDEFYSKTTAVLSETELEIQDEVISLVKEKDWQGLFNLSDYTFMDF